MPGSLVPTVLYAQGAAAKGGGGAGGGGSLAPLLMPMVLIIVLYYFLLIRPQTQRQKDLRNLREALKKNDRVLTEAGIYGTVMTIDEKADKVVLRIDDEKGVRLTCRRSSIIGVIDGEKAAAAE